MTILEDEHVQGFEQTLETAKHSRRHSAVCFCFCARNAKLMEQRVPRSRGLEAVLFQMTQHIAYHCNMWACTFAWKAALDVA